MPLATPEDDAPLNERPDLLQDQHLPPPPKQERSRQKREALLQAGLALFAEHGYEATTVDSIAAQAGVAVGGFYQHFASKQQLLLVLMDQMTHATALLTLDCVSQEQAELQRSIEHLVRQALHLDWAYAGAYRAWREAAVQDHEMRKLYQRIEAWIVQQMTLLIQRLLKFPNARKDVDVPTLAWILTLLLVRLAEVPLAHPDAVVASLSHLITHTIFTD